MLPGITHNYDPESTRKVGYAYYLFSLTFLITIIATLTLQTGLEYLGIFIGFIGLIIVFTSRKSLELDFKDDLIRGIGIYIFFEIIVSVVVAVYILSAVSSLIASYPNGIYPRGAFSNIVITGVYIEVIPSLLLYISYYFMNRVFFRNGKKRRLMLLLFLSFILYIVSFAGEIQEITLKLSSINSLSSASSTIDLIKAHPLNVFTIPSVLGALILLLIYYYSGRALVTNPSSFTESGKLW